MSLVDVIMEVSRRLRLKVKVFRTSCSDLRREGARWNVPGVYVFAEHGGHVLYIGQCSSILHRVYREHCRAHIGGSEGVVRFLMFLLDCVCKSGYEDLDVKERERLVKELLRDFIWNLDLYLVIGEGLADRAVREKLEGELRRVLRPVLNPV